MFINIIDVFIYINTNDFIKYRIKTFCSFVYDLMITYLHFKIN